MSRLRTSLSPTTVIAVLALFLAIGGTGYAAARLSGSQIVIRSIPGNRLQAHTVTGKEIRLGGLGKVPLAHHADSALTATNAVSLGGVAKSGFAQGGGSVLNHASTLVPGSDEISLLNIAQVGAIRGSCDSSDQEPSIHLDNSAATSHDVSIVVHASNLGQAAYFGAPIGAGTKIKAPDQAWELQAASATGNPTRTLSLRITAYTRGGTCHFLFNGTGDLGMSIPTPA